MTSDIWAKSRAAVSGSKPPPGSELNGPYVTPLTVNLWSPRYTDLPRIDGRGAGVATSVGPGVADGRAWLGGFSVTAVVIQDALG